MCSSSISLSLNGKASIAYFKRNRGSSIGSRSLHRSLHRSQPSTKFRWRKIPLEEGARRFLNTQFVLTWSRDMPPATVILEGSWWPAQPAQPTESLVSVQEFAAQALGLKVGSILERSEEHTSELQSRRDLVCRLL